MICSRLFWPSAPIIPSKLRPFCVTPGSTDQLRLIRYVLVELLGRTKADAIPLGAQAWPQNANKRGCVDLKHYAKQVFQFHAEDLKNNNSKSQSPLEQMPVDRDQVHDAAELMGQIFSQERRDNHNNNNNNNNCVLLTCGPVHNLAAALPVLSQSNNTHTTITSIQIPKWVAQGGFCGSNVVNDETKVETLPQFVGRTHYPSWNFGGCIDGTLRALQADEPTIGTRILVGKNVCHRCVYQREVLEPRLKEWVDVAAAARGQGKNQKKIHQQRQKAAAWIQQTRQNKKLHDPLALATLIDPEGVCELREVRVDVQDETKHWGSTLCPGTRTFAAVDYSHERFLDAILPIDDVV